MQNWRAFVEDSKKYLLPYLFQVDQREDAV